MSQIDSAGSRYFFAETNLVPFNVTSAKIRDASKLTKYLLKQSLSIQKEVQPQAICSNSCFSRSRIINRWWYVLNSAPIMQQYPLLHPWLNAGRHHSWFSIHHQDPKNIIQTRLPFLYVDASCIDPDDWMNV